MKVEVVKNKDVNMINYKHGFLMQDLDILRILDKQKIDYMEKDFILEMLFINIQVNKQEKKELKNDFNLKYILFDI